MVIRAWRLLGKRPEEDGLLCISQVVSRCRPPFRMGMSLAAPVIPASFSLDVVIEGILVALDGQERESLSALPLLAVPKSGFKVFDMLLFDEIQSVFSSRIIEL